MCDRCAANHAAVRIVSSEWKKPINELNCHLHPLNSFATVTRTALKKIETTRGKCLEVTALPPISFCRLTNYAIKTANWTPMGLFNIWTSTMFLTVFFPGIEVIVSMSSSTLVEFSLNATSSS